MPIALIIQVLTAWLAWKVIKVGLIIALAVLLEELVADAITAIGDALVSAEGMLTTVAGYEIPIVQMIDYMGITTAISAMIGALTAVFFVSLAYRLLGIT